MAPPAPFPPRERKTTIFLIFFPLEHTPPFILLLLIIYLIKYTSPQYLLWHLCNIHLLLPSSIKKSPSQLPGGVDGQDGADRLTFRIRSTAGSMNLSSKYRWILHHVEERRAPPGGAWATTLHFWIKNGSEMIDCEL